MSKKRKLLEKVLSGSKNLQFDDLVTLVEAFGFSLSRINGSHTFLLIQLSPNLLTYKIVMVKLFLIRFVNF